MATKAATPAEKPAAPVADPTPAGGGAPSADKDDFVSESYSVMEATEATPADTTAGATDGPPLAAAAADSGDEGDELEGTESAAADEPSGEPGVDVESASQSTKPAKGAKPTKAAKHAPEARKKSLQAEIDRQTYERERIRRDVEAENANLARLRAERATLEGRKPAAETKPAEPAEGPRPVRPKLADYDDYPKYEAALDAWEASADAWQEKRTARLRTEIETGLDSRLSRADQQRAVNEREQAVNSRVQAAKAAHPDFAEKAKALPGLRSSWYEGKEKHGDSPTPFLSDLTHNGEADGGELVYFLADLASTDPDRAQRLADLRPTVAIKEAMLQSPSTQSLLEHFSTEDGAEEFDAIRRMHPTRQILAIGALETRLADASRGPSAAAVPAITQATPSAKPPAGSPRARESTGAGKPGEPFNFDNWMAEEDARELEVKKSLLGAHA